MTRLLPVLFLMLLFACNEPRRPQAKNDSTVAPPHYVSYQFDEEDEPIVFGQHFYPDSSTFYAVYEIAPGMSALVITADPTHYAGQKMEPVDSLLSLVVASNAYFKNEDVDSPPLKNIVDTSGRFTLFEAEEVTEAMSGFFESEFTSAARKAS